MAATKKKKKGNGKTDGVKVVCKMCGEAKALSTHFYKSNRPDYAETGYCDVCKSCIKDMMINPETEMIDKQRFKLEVCKLLDIPFIPYEFTGLMQNPRVTTSNFFGEYRKKLTLNSQYKGLHYDDSARFENDEAGLLKEKNAPPPDQVTPEMIEFWGQGFTAEYYLDVQKRFDNFMKDEDLDKMDYKKESDYKTLCQLERKKNEMMLSKDAKMSDIKSVIDAISKLSDDLSIKTTQKKQDENDISHYSVGLTAKYIEDVKLEPIPEFDDSDYMGDHSRLEFLKMMAYFTSPLLSEYGMQNLLEEIVEEDKKQYTPTQEDLNIASMEPDDLEVDY